MEKSRFYDIIKYNDGKLTKWEDEVVAEFWLDLFVDGAKFVRLLCTPESLESLAVGFLKSDGIISSREDVKDIRVDTQKKAVFVATSSPEATKEKIAGKKVNIVGTSKGIVSDSLYETNAPKARPDIELDIDRILDIVSDFSSMSGLFSATGGAHSCAISDGQKLLDFKEDIGRHNAVDKIVGNCMLEGIDTSDKLLILSGRVSSEMLLKAINAGFYGVISRAAPTDAAIDIARENGIILCGFARGRKMNIYTDFPSRHF
ncbi:formate dehydrogenase family accessory protein FdhD [Peptoclostridium acidaminophilum DSM 3953]|uniref:Protein FdhD n=2 Tax=Peptoclostridium acidaminophilum TaxID=1731 RepID=W8T1Y2_PEPAC|nr:formate dehydrogenase accessory sulfurtransferase FdhD [Peptoclostridium acidaminophilum]AHM55739.1 formate dehydrogenase family accessory protein FdhD [Peptoclostridium acidaminophilum DSM 3953]CAC39237.1 FdhD protein [Peptoclostridium acidaminophilum DSM 3953]